jgi:purine-binding chemotaxis protein CheW
MRHTPPDAPVASSPATSRGGKYLTFCLGKEEYGIGILKVREIIGFMDITAVPRAPEFVRGVINLRGQVISVVDLRAKFGMPPVDRTEATCIIVVEVPAADTAPPGGRTLSIGVVVDRVSEVLSIPAEQVEDPPAFGNAVDADVILGMGKVGQSVKILLDIDRVLSVAEAEDLVARAA